VGAEAPDAVTVTLYVLDCLCCGLLDDVPQPARASAKRKSNIHRALVICQPDETRIEEAARPEPAPIPKAWPSTRLLLVALTVIFVLCGALPDSVEGAKLQPHPLGRPEQAKDNEALNPFSGATETVKDPDVPCVTWSECCWRA
jgi:hypothetical protein